LHDFVSKQRKSEKDHQPGEPVDAGLALIVCRGYSGSLKKSTKLQGGSSFNALDDGRENEWGKD
jgi:hypothetical protein